VLKVVSLSATSCTSSILLSKGLRVLKYNFKEISLTAKILLKASIRIS
jgi:hypothetical protein